MSERAEWKETAGRKRVRGLIVNELNKLFVVYDEIPVGVHLVNILRTREKNGCSNDPENKIPNKRDPYHLSDEEILKDLLSYARELEEKAIDDEE